MLICRFNFARIVVQIFGSELTSFLVLLYRCWCSYFFVCCCLRKSSQFTMNGRVHYLFCVYDSIVCVCVCWTHSQVADKKKNKKFQYWNWCQFIFILLWAATSVVGITTMRTFASHQRLFHCMIFKYIFCVCMLCFWRRFKNINIFFLYYHIKRWSECDRFT